ncbi:lyase family protein [Klebsiella pneumoniae]
MSLLTPMLRSSPLTDWFSDAQRVQGMLDFEAALAQAQAACGMVPPEAVGPIVAACRHEAIDFAALGEAAVGAGNLAIPLVKQLTAQVKARDPEAARYVHWGATSQDAIDTGLVLQLRGALDAAETLLEQLLAALALQADRYRDTVMPGRTWMQHALPVTFGLKLAGTLDALLRWQQRLREMRPRLLALQFGGAAGTLDALKEKGPAVGLALAQILGLSLPDTPWHSQRDRLLEAGAWFAGVCGTLGKFANDFSLLMQTEVAEVGGALAQSESLVRDMQVFPQKMRADLDITHGLIMAEAVTLALAEFIGKAEAHHHIEALCRQALDRHCPLVDLLAADPQVSQYLSRERLTTLLDPATATGSAERFVRQVLARYQEQRDES